eukprot:3679340-Amphidinium_carterae.1
MIHWYYYLPFTCAVSALLNLATNPASDSLFSECVGSISYVLGHVINWHTGGTSALRCLVYRSSKAATSRSLSGTQMVGIYYQLVCMATLAYVRMSVADTIAGLPESGSDRDAKIAQSSFGTVVKRPYESALGLAGVILLSA